MFPFIRSAETDAWHPEAAKPVVTLVWQGTPKLRDVAIFARALLPGQTLRLVSDSPLPLSVLEPICASQGLELVRATEDRALVYHVCYTHYYADLQTVREPADRQPTP
jgi:hypothetical protein